MITFEDYLEITQVVADYCLHTDNGDADSFMACWVEPNEFGGYDSGAFGKMDTWQQMYDFEKEHVAEGGMANGKRHEIANLKISPVSDSEVSVTHDLIVLEVANEPMIIATGRYNNSVVVKTDKGWKFKRRTLDVDSGFFKLMERINQSSAA